MKTFFRKKLTLKIDQDFFKAKNFSQRFLSSEIFYIRKFSGNCFYRPNNQNKIVLEKLSAVKKQLKLIYFSSQFFAYEIIF